jgi:hypothetical protein
MAISSRPLKKVGGALQELSVSEEDYIAFLASTHLGNMSTTDVSALTAIAYGGSLPDSRLVGIFEDCYYTEGVGGDADSLTVNKTGLYQRRGFAPYNDSGLRRPVLSYDRNTGALREMGYEALDLLCERLLYTIMSNEYPGAFRLSSTSPGADWAEFLPDVFQDTAVAGNTTFSIWIRKDFTTGPHPSPEVLPFMVERENGFTGDALGVKRFTRQQIAYTLGQRMKTVVMGSDHDTVGQYQLRSSVDGPPTDPGTWVARGTATDTKGDTLPAAGYTALPYIQAYSANYVTEYSLAPYVGNYQNLFIGGTYEQTYFKAYLNEYTTQYDQNYVSYATYEANYESIYVGDYSSGYLSYVGTYDAIYEIAIDERSYNVYGIGPYESPIYSDAASVDYALESYTGTQEYFGFIAYTAGLLVNYTSGGYTRYTGNYGGELGNAYSNEYIAVTYADDITAYTYSIGYVRDYFKQSTIIGYQPYLQEYTSPSDSENYERDIYIGFDPGYSEAPRPYIADYTSTYGGVKEYVISYSGEKQYEGRYETPGPYDGTGYNPVIELGIYEGTSPPGEYLDTTYIQYIIQSPPYTDYSGAYLGPRNYEGTYAGGEYESNYVAKYVGFYISDVPYSAEYGSEKSDDYEGNYESEVSVEYDVLYSNAYFPTISNAYQKAQVVAPYTGVYNVGEPYESEYIQTHTAIYAQDYNSETSVDYEIAYIDAYFPTVSNAYQRPQVVAPYTGVYNVGEPYESEYIQTHTAIYAQEYNSESSTDYTVQYIPNYAKTTIASYANKTYDTYEGNYIVTVSVPYGNTSYEVYLGTYELGDGLNNSPYSNEYIGTYAFDYISNYRDQNTILYTGEYEGRYEATELVRYSYPYQNNYIKTVTENYIPNYESPGYVGTYQDVYASDVYESTSSIDYIQDVIYVGVAPYTLGKANYSGYVSTSSIAYDAGDYTSTSTVDYQRYAIEPYDIEYVAEPVYDTYQPAGYIGTYITTQTVEYTGRYTGDYFRPTNLIGYDALPYLGGFGEGLPYIPTYIVGPYAGEYALTDFTDYLGNYEGNYDRVYQGDEPYVGSYAKDYSTVPYAGTYGIEYEQEATYNTYQNQVGYVSTSSIDYVQEATYNTYQNDVGYRSTSSQAYEAGDYTSTSTIDYQRYDLQPYDHIYQAGGPGDYEGTYITTQTVEYVGRYTGDYASPTDLINYDALPYLGGFGEGLPYIPSYEAGPYTGIYVLTIYTTYLGNYEGNYDRAYQGDNPYVGNYEAEYETPGYVGNYGIEYEQEATYNTYQNQVGYVSTSSVDYVQQPVYDTYQNNVGYLSTSSIEYDAGPVGGYISTSSVKYELEQNYVGAGAVNYRSGYVSTSSIAYDAGNYTSTSSIAYEAGDYTSTSTIDYQRYQEQPYDIDYQAGEPGDYEGTYITTQTINYTGRYSGIYAGEGDNLNYDGLPYLGGFGEGLPYIPNYESGPYEGNYQKTTSDTYDGNYLGNYERSFTGPPYIKTTTDTFQGTNYTSTSSQAYEAGNYLPTYEKEYVGLSYTKTTTVAFDTTPGYVSTSSVSFTGPPYVDTYNKVYARFVAENYDDSYDGDPYVSTSSVTFTGPPYVDTYNKVYARFVAENYDDSYDGLPYTSTSTVPYARIQPETYLRTFSGPAYGEAYSRTSTIVYDGNYQGNYLGGTDAEGFPYIGTYIGFTGGESPFPYLGEYVAGPYVGVFNQSYEAVYSKDYISTSSVPYEGNYTGNYTRTFSGPAYTSTSSVPYEGNYTGNYTRTFSGPSYTSTSSATYQGNYTGNYLRTFEGPSYQSTSSVPYNANYEGNYSRLFSGPPYISTASATYEGNYTGNYSRLFSGPAYQSTSSVPYAATYTGNYIRTFSGPSYQSTSTVPYARVQPETYIRTFSGPAYTSTSSVPYDRIQPENYTITFSGPGYTSTSSAEYQREQSTADGPTLQYSGTQPYAGNYGGPATTFFGVYEGLGPFGTFPYTGNYVGPGTPYSGNYVGPSPGFLAIYTGGGGEYAKNVTNVYTGNYRRTFSGPTYTSTSSATYQGNYTGNYTRTFSGPSYTSTSSVPYEGNYTGNYLRTFEGPSYTSTSSVPYARVQPETYIRTFEGPSYTSTSTVPYARVQPENYTITFTGPPYISTSTVPYARLQPETYIRTFEGPSYQSTSTTPYARVQPENYTITFSGPAYGSTSSVPYDRIQPETYIRTFSGPAYTSTSSVPYDRIQPETYTRTFTGPPYGGEYTSNYGAEYQGEYTTTFDVPYSGVYLGQYSGTREGYVAVYTNSPPTGVGYLEYEAVYQVGVAGYLKDYTSTSTVPYEGNYEGNYSRLFSGPAYTDTSFINYEGNYEGNYSAAYEGLNSGYISTSTIAYEGDIGYIDTSFINYEGNYEGNYSAAYEGLNSGYISTSTVAYEGDVPYIKTVSVAYENDVPYGSNTFIGYTNDVPYIATTSDAFQGTAYQSTSSISYNAGPVEGYISTSTVDYERHQTEPYTGTYELDPPYSGNYVPTFDRPYLATYTGDYDRGVDGYSSVYSTAGPVGGYISYNAPPYIRPYLGVYTGTYDQIYIGNYEGNYERRFDNPTPYIATTTDQFDNPTPYIATTTDTFQGLGYLKTTTDTFTGPPYIATTTDTFTGPPYAGNYIRTYAGDAYIGTYAQDYAQDPPYSSVYALAYIQDPPYQSTTFSDYQRYAIEPYQGEYEADPYDGTYVPTFDKDYRATYLGNYVQAEDGYLRGYATAGPAGGYILYNAPPYVRPYLGVYTGTYDQIYIGNYEGNYARRFEGITYIATTTDTFTGPPYAGNYVKPYAGEGYVGTYAQDYLQEPVYDTYQSLGYESNYEDIYEQDPPYQSTRFADYQRYAIEPYQGEYDVGAPYEGVYVPTFDKNYRATYEGSYIQAEDGYLRGYATNVANVTYILYNAPPYVRPYSGTYAGNYDQIYIGNYEGNYEQRFEGITYIATTTDIFAGDQYTANYVTGYDGPGYEGSYAEEYQQEPVYDTYQRDIGYVGTYANDNPYTGVYEGPFAGEYDQNYFADYFGDTPNPIYDSYVRGPYIGEYGGEYAGIESVYQGPEYTGIGAIVNYAGEIAVNYEIKYGGLPDNIVYQQAPYAGAPVAPEAYQAGPLSGYIGFTGGESPFPYAAPAYTGFASAIYIGTYVGPLGYTQKYSGGTGYIPFLAIYEGSSPPGEYVLETYLAYQATYIELYGGEYESNYEHVYESPAYIATYVKTTTEAYDVVYAGEAYTGLVDNPTFLGYLRGPYLGVYEIEYGETYEGVSNYLGANVYQTLDDTPNYAGAGYSDYIAGPYEGLPSNATYSGITQTYLTDYTGLGPVWNYQKNSYDPYEGNYGGELGFNYDDYFKQTFPYGVAYLQDYFGSPSIQLYDPGPYIGFIGGEAPLPFTEQYDSYRPSYASTSSTVDVDAYTSQIQYSRTYSSPSPGYQVVGSLASYDGGGAEPYIRFSYQEYEAAYVLDGQDYEQLYVTLYESPPYVSNYALTVSNTYQTEYGDQYDTYLGGKTYVSEGLGRYSAQYFDYVAGPYSVPYLLEYTGVEDTYMADYIGQGTVKKYTRGGYETYEGNYGNNYLPYINIYQNPFEQQYERDIYIGFDPGYTEAPRPYINDFAASYGGPATYLNVYLGERFYTDNYQGPGEGYVQPPFLGAYFNGAGPGEGEPFLDFNYVAYDFGYILDGVDYEKEYIAIYESPPYVSNYALTVSNTYQTEYGDQYDTYLGGKTYVSEGLGRYSAEYFDYLAGPYSEEYADSYVGIAQTYDFDYIGQGTVKKYTRGGYETYEGNYTNNYFAYITLYQNPFEKQYDRIIYLGFDPGYSEAPRPYIADFASEYGGPAVYSTVYLGERDYTDNYQGPGEGYSLPFLASYFDGAGPGEGEPFLDFNYTSYVQDYRSTYNPTYTGTYDHVFSSPPYVDDYFSDYRGDYDNAYVSNYADQYTGAYGANYIDIAIYANYTSNYIVTATVPYEGNYSGNYDFNYEGNYDAVYDGIYSSPYATYVANYDVTVGYDGAISYEEEAYVDARYADYEGNYEANYANEYQDEYLKVYASPDPFAEAYQAVAAYTIEIETYTLYVRVA